MNSSLRVCSQRSLNTWTAHKVSNHCVRLSHEMNSSLGVSSLFYIVTRYPHSWRLRVMQNPWLSSNKCWRTNFQYFFRMSVKKNNVSVYSTLFLPARWDLFSVEVLAMTPRLLLTQKTGLTNYIITAVLPTHEMMRWDETRGQISEHNLESSQT
jgi:hypothetical protein